jgi:hypothetical protein
MTLAVHEQDGLLGARADGAPDRRGENELKEFGAEVMPILRKGRPAALTAVRPPNPRPKGR